MSQDFDALLNEVEASTTTLMDVDTSYLDAYRRGGIEGLKEAEQAEIDADAADHADAVAQDPSPELETNENEAPSQQDLDTASGQHGGSSSSGGSGGAPAESTATAQGDQAAPADIISAEDLDGETDEPVSAVFASSDIDGSVPPVSLQLTDHQDAAQADAMADVDSSEKGDNDAVFRSSTELPYSGFQVVPDEKGNQPNIKSLPTAVIAKLREQLRDTAVRELSVSEQAARAYSEKLSQRALVTAFLLARLDIPLAADPATARAVELFRAVDPLLGSVVTKLGENEKIMRKQGELLAKVVGELTEVRTTAEVVEQALAYSIADRSENFLRGQHDIRDAPLGHKDAIFVRDRAREATRKQSKLEQERDGRPMR